MSYATGNTAEIVPFDLRGSAGQLSAWRSAPPDGVEVRGTALLVPGFTGSKEDFEAMLPRLARAGFHCVAYDQRGQWESDGSDDPADYTLRDFAGDLLGVAEQIGAPVHLVGHSFGGYVSRAAVLADPGRFRSLTLLASGPTSVRDIAFPPPRSVAGMVEAGGQQAIWEQMSSAMSALPDAKRDFLHRRIMATKKANLVGILHTMETVDDDIAGLRAAAMPILIAYGDTGDLWAPAVHERYADDLGARRVVYPGVGHLPNEERPEQVCADLTAFWAEVDSRR
ncbi:MULTISPECIES: alpha/beta fold hydrolase [unclassified Nocardia]|uniref:alpha/beta fold hydrolase n=1 Tax=unclassified Nocardia TaxID=2637762 RepID=UPI001CE44A22|nr:MULTISPECIES: alpha/beta hydrolase [unclassified Nocardia]